MKKGTRAWLNNLSIPLAEREKYIKEHGGTTPFAEEKDYGPCPVKTCENPEMMENPFYYVIPLFGKDSKGKVAHVCRKCFDKFCESKDKENWEEENFGYKIRKESA